MSDIDTVVVDSLKALDPKRPIREADIASAVRFEINEAVAKRKSPDEGLGALSGLRNGSKAQLFLFDCLLLNRPPEKRCGAGPSEPVAIGLRTPALALPLASMSAQAQADSPCPFRFWRRKPKGKPL